MRMLVRRFLFLEGQAPALTLNRFARSQLPHGKQRNHFLQLPNRQP